MPFPPVPPSWVQAERVSTDAEELRKAENAAALLESERFLATDPSIGKPSCMPPIGSPRLQQEILVAPNGRCLANCCIAATRPEDWEATTRKPDGTAASLARIVQEDEWAREFLLTKVLEAGMPEERVADLVMGSFAEAKDLAFFAKAIGGSIGVEPPPAEQGVQSTTYYGDGPLMLTVGLYYMETNGAPHYKLLQSWQ